MNEQLLGAATIEELSGEPVLTSRALQEVLIDRAELLEVISERPYTMVRIRTYYDGAEYIGSGFSKVKWPDPWDEGVGRAMAYIHAVRGIARKIKGIQKDFNHQR